MAYELLIEKALEARKNSYSPYSCYKVGAALETAEGKIYTGCNVENASYSATNCGERTAIFKAVSEGYRDFKRIVVTGGREEMPEDYAFPCGVCRQVMAEFCDSDFEIIVAKSTSEYKVYALAELLPERFGKSCVL